MNEAILVFGDVHGQVNALLFSAATMALFDRPSQPAGSKQGTVTSPGGGGGTLGICGWECAAGTLKPLTYTRASSAEFCCPILE